ncbi:hypothetical protein CJF30_00009381 [Rutstroemia sp. NJR-2017a BBW]|nr:hypothetical protein CJF30_00009381 [Rutstroemia sp. NJR-2017a BBW]
MSDQEADVDGEGEGEGEGEDGPDQEEEVEDKPAGKEYIDDPLLDSPPSYNASTLCFYGRWSYKAQFIEPVTGIGTE